MINLDWLDSDWSNILEKEIKNDYFKEIMVSLNNDINKWQNIYPKIDDIFNALKYTPYNDIKVVILWQDPYHWTNQAHGLSFSVLDNVKIPPSLKNIFKELKNDIWVDIPESWNLEKWAQSWVLLLNAIFTVIEKKPWSHSKIWWEQLSDNIIKNISQNKENIVFILWWNFARNKKKFIDENKHFIIESPHPSPFSAYNWFFGSMPFSKTNYYLQSKWIEKINWTL